MSSDGMQEMAKQCVETMQAMAGMMGMHRETGGMPAADGMGGMGAMMDMGGMGAAMDMGGWLGWAILGMLLVGIVVAFAVVLTRGRRTEVVSAGARPLDELDRRYARGEVDRDAYLQARGDLQQARS